MHAIAGWHQNQGPRTERQADKIRREEQTNPRRYVKYRSNLPGKMQSQQREINREVQIYDKQAKETNKLLQMWEEESHGKEMQSNCGGPGLW